MGFLAVRPNVPLIYLLILALLFVFFFHFLHLFPVLFIFFYLFRVYFFSYLFLKNRFATFPVLTNNQKGLQQLMDNLNRVTQKFGMKINVKKTKVNCISKDRKTKVKICINVGTNRKIQISGQFHIGR